MKSSTVKDTIVLLFYGAVTAVMTYPAITIVSRTYAEPRDPLGVLWWSWWFRYSFTHHLPVTPMPLVSVPWGLKTNVYSQDQLSTLITRGLSIVAKETVTYNLVLLLSFFLSAAAMYYLVRYLTRDRGAAALSGLAFGFCPYMLAHGKEHLGLAATFWLPLFALLLIRAWRRRTWGSVVAGSVIFIVLTLYNSQYGMLAAVFAVVYVLTYWLTGRPLKHGRWDWRLFLKGLAATFVIVIVIALLLVGLLRSPAGKPKATFGAYQFSARPWDYFIPGAESAVFGKLTRGFIESHLHGGFLVESSLFIGYTILALALYALIGTLIRPRPAAREKPERIASGDVLDVPGRSLLVDEARTIWALTACAIVAFLLSMPPTTDLFGVKIYLPSYLFLKLIPQFRAYARFGVIVMMCATVLAGFGLAKLLSMLSLKRYRSVFVAVLMALVIVEFTIVPPFYSLETNSTTDYYRWLEKQPGRSVTAVYPLFASDDFFNYGYSFAQRLHGKDLVNGAKPDTLANRYRESVLDVKNPSTPGLLKRLGTKYVMVIPSFYEGPDIHANYVFPIIMKENGFPAGLELVEKFDDCIVYEVTAPPSEFIPLFEWGTYDAYLDSEGSVWHPGIDRVFINIKSELERPAACDIKLKMMSAGAVSKVTFEVNGKLQANMVVPVWPVDVVIPDVIINPGNNRLRVHSDGPRSNLTGVRGYDRVSASMLLGDITVEKKQ